MYCWHSFAAKKMFIEDEPLHWTQYDSTQQKVTETRGTERKKNMSTGAGGGGKILGEIFKSVANSSQGRSAVRGGLFNLLKNGKISKGFAGQAAWSVFSGVLQGLMSGGNQKRKTVKTGSHRGHTVNSGKVDDDYSSTIGGERRNRPRKHVTGSSSSRTSSTSNNPNAWSSAQHDPENHGQKFWKETEHSQYGTKDPFPTRQTSSGESRTANWWSSAEHDPSKHGQKFWKETEHSGKQYQDPFPTRQTQAEKNAERDPFWRDK